jgi:hypothetical protein
MYFALFPFAQNIDEFALGIKLSQFRYFIIIISIVLLLTFLVGWLLKDELRSGIVSSTIIFFVFSYGHINSFLHNSLPVNKSGLDYFLIPLWVVFCVVIIRWVNKESCNFARINQALNYMSLALLIFPLYKIILFAYFKDQTLPQIEPYLKQIREDVDLVKIEPSTSIENEDYLPDIYYIILDGYTRADVLQTYFDYDNTQFLDFLHQRGFYIAERSSSNYTETAASIPSTLNMSYISDLPDYLRSLNPKFDNFTYLLSMSEKLVENSLVIRFLKENGYKIISIDSGFDLTRLKSGDDYLSSPRVHHQNQGVALEVIIMDSTIAGIFSRLRGEDFVPVQSLYDDHRERILYALDNLPLPSVSTGPHFVLSHIICPHNPYVFNAEGEPIYYSDPYTLVDLNTSGSWSPELYSGQVEFINQRIMLVIDEILSKSSTPPIIILQGDHSHRMHDLEEMSDEAELDRLFPILNAYLLPNRNFTQLYPSISPVNSFRIVLNEYFGIGLDLLPDERYIFNRGYPQDFVDACEIYNCGYVAP